MSFAFTKKILLCAAYFFLCFNLNAKKSESNTEEIIEFPPHIIPDYGIDTLNPSWDDAPLATYDSERDIDKPYSFVDEEAEYPGGLVGIMQFVGENYIYPDVALENQIEGKLYVRFVVNTDGTVSNVSIEQKMIPSCPECEKEAIRVIRKMNGWKPGRVAGKRVPQWYIIPISLDLEDEEPENTEEKTNEGN